MSTSVRRDGPYVWASATERNGTVTEYAADVSTMTMAVRAWLRGAQVLGRDCHLRRGEGGIWFYRFAAHSVPAQVALLREMAANGLQGAMLRGVLEEEIARVERGDWLSVYRGPLQDGPVEEQLQDALEEASDELTARGHQREDG